MPGSTIWLACMYSEISISGLRYLENRDIRTKIRPDSATKWRPEHLYRVRLYSPVYVEYLSGYRIFTKLDRFIHKRVIKNVLFMPKRSSLAESGYQKSGLSQIDFLITELVRLSKFDCICIPTIPTLKLVQVRGCLRIIQSGMECKGRSLKYYKIVWL
jgi:hypothetical protein